MLNATKRRQQNITENNRDIIEVESFAAFWNFVGCKNITIIGSHFRDCILRFADCSRVNILRNSFDGCVGSNYIQFAPDDPCDHVTISGNYFVSPLLPFYRDDDGEVADNGATGDVIGLKNVKHFVVSGNNIGGGGELGIAIVHGCEWGVIADNKIASTDAGGIWIGNRDQNRCAWIAVTGNEITGCGINAAPMHNAINQSGVSFLNGKYVTIANNTITENESDLRFAVCVNEATDIVVGGNRTDAPVQLRVPKKGRVERLVSDWK
jgi:hypothetical protein